LGRSERERKNKDERKPTHEINLELRNPINSIKKKRTANNRMFVSGLFNPLAKWFEPINVGAT
jgi:hypothetical protein